MHDHGIRAPLHSRHDLAKQRVFVAAVLLLVAAVTALAPRLAHSAARPEIELSRAPELLLPDTNLVHDIAIELVGPGREGIQLSARLSEDGGIIGRPINWTVRSAAGEPVFTGETDIADIALAPGDYMIEARYGTMEFARTLTLLAGNRVVVSFVLNVGALRILPRVQGLGLPATQAQTLIYAASGRRKGELVARSAVPGEIIRVSAGEYRIESRFATGNAVAVTDVEVKPGIMSAVEIDHAAGLARLVFGGAQAAVTWSIESASGEALAEIAGVNAEVVLKPGSYTATARAGGETLSQHFAIAAGEAREILFGKR